MIGDIEDTELSECNARCWATGVFYAVAYFQGKPSRERNLCDPHTCLWKIQRKDTVMW
jgi:hypothetical protein